MNYYKHIIYTSLILCTGWAVQAQDTTEKLKERFNTNEDVVINLDTQYADVVFEDWNKDEVEVEAVLETEGLNDDEIAALLDTWRIGVQGNSRQVNIQSGGTGGLNIVMNKAPLSGLDEIIASSMEMVQPLMQNMLGPMMEGFAGSKLPEEYYNGMRNIEFDYDAYKRDGEKYLKEYERKVKSNFGDDFDKVMQKWEEENKGKMQQWKMSFGDEMLGLPKSPFGTTNINFNKEAYEKDKKGYVAKLNKKYHSNASVRAVDAWLSNVDKWANKFEGDMQQWGEQFGKRMEKWGENYGAQMEQDLQAWGENFGQAMEAWGENFGRQMEQMARNEGGNYNEQTTTDKHGNVHKSYSYSYNSNNTSKRVDRSRGKRTIIIRMPDASKLDVNVRHGNVQLSEASNARINLSHGNFTAQNINGNSTYVTVAYSPIQVENWNHGTLQTNYVKQCIIENAQNIKVDARGSNVVINKVDGAAMISGSFGELSIPEVGKNFKSLNINLENSDLVLKIPESAFHFTYNGTRSNFNYPSKIESKSMESYDSKMVNGFYKSRDTDRAISISAKFSDVVVK